MFLREVLDQKLRFFEAQVCFVQDFVLSLLVVNLLSLRRC
jgi:hypothetical protein